MNIAFIGFLSFCFVGMTLINRVLEGSFIGSGDTSILNNLTIFRNITMFGTFTIPVPNVQFITEGIPHLVKWDYSFFGGSGGLIQYFFYSMTGAVSFGLFVLTIGVFSYYLSRR